MIQPKPLASYLGISIFLFLSVLLPAKSYAVNASLGMPAQEWDVRDWFNSRPLSLEDLSGKVILVRWWTAPMCPFCINSAPALNKFYQDYHQEGLEVIGFFHHKALLELNKDDVQSFANEFEFKFPIAIDYHWKTLKKWWLKKGQSWSSVTFLIDRQGIIRHIHPGGEYIQGDEDYAEMKEMIEKLL